MLTEKEKERYNRHLIIPEIGEAGQEKLKSAKVLVIGAGGLGCPILLYLAAAGVGYIGIVDGDTVSCSNLQRQILFTEEEIGKSKAEIAGEKLRKLNSSVNIRIFPTFLDEALAEELFKEYDLVVGATDNFPSRYIIDRYTQKAGIPFVHGSILEFEGQVCVFNYRGSLSYSDLFPDPTESSELPLGVMGVLPGIIGSIMGAEVLKIITGIGEVLSNHLLIYNILEHKFIKLSV